MFKKGKALTYILASLVAASLVANTQDWIDGNGQYVRTAPSSSLPTLISTITASNKAKATTASQSCTAAALVLRGGPSPTSKVVDAWTLAASKVSGPANALYQQPSSNPLYASTAARLSHLRLRKAVAKHIHGRQRSLRAHWLNLAISFVAGAKRHTLEATKDKAQREAMDRISHNIKNDLPIDTGGSAHQPLAGVAPVSDRGRRARRSVDGGVRSDYAGSEYELEMIAKEIERVEAFEKRIENGKVHRDKIPRMIGKLERSISGRFVDTGGTRRVVDGEWQESHLVNPWSDIEKVRAVVAVHVSGDTRKN